MIGSVIDKYEVLQKLGEGATATVYRGRHMTIGKDVAIKILHPHLSASSRNRERFNREARAVGRLSHQNIVTILDYSGREADDCYIVTELIDGVTLLELIQEHGRIPSEIVILLGIELCAALAFAHHEGVIHRDIKPENIMIRRDGKVKLMDFGVARVLDEGSMTLDGSLLGSPAYMSPQQALDQPLDGRSDLFSVGTLLFHAVTGQVPFSGTNASVILRNIIEANRPEVLEMAPMVSPSLAAVIDHLLQVRAEDRCPSAEIARDALIACLDDVKLPRDHAVINLRGYLVDAAGCTAALHTHLRAVLLERGKEKLAAGDHLVALQSLNRLLAIDEAEGNENAEVITLIQSLHEPNPPPARPRWMYGLAAVVGACAVSLGVWYWTGSQLPPPRPHLAPVTGAADTPENAGAALPTTAGASVPASSGGLLDAGIATTGALPVDVAAPPLPSPGVARPGALPDVPRSPSRTALADITGTSRAAASEAVSGSSTGTGSTPPAGDATLVVRGSTWAEVHLDGKKVGQWRHGPASNWVATEENPLRVSPGDHTLSLRNPYSEPFDVPVTLIAGEHKEVTVVLQRKPITFIVNTALPRDCLLTVGGVAYGTVEQFSGSFTLREPDPATQLSFECPPPWGRVQAVIGATAGGETRVIPARLTPPQTASP